MQGRLFYFYMVKRIVIIALIIVSGIVYSTYQKRNFESQLAASNETILSKLPQGLFETLDGRPLDPHEFFQNRPGLMVVHFWGTWCAPCEAELPDLLSFIEKFKGQREVIFILVAVNDEKNKIEKKLKSLSIPNVSIQWLMDNKNIHRDIYGTTRVPETYVFSSDKTTLRKFVGPQEWNKPLFFQTFDELMQISTSKM